jgi:sterol desaturase/sphingolipid hydroxylase (fatty acid hydroxylase superfamily)
LWHVVLYTALVLAYDFTDYASHVLLHRIPFLWEFHKLHHSAEVMTPITVTRVHPIEQIAGAVIATPIVGIASGIAAYVFLREPSPLLLFGAPAVQVLFFAGGYHLRHSHVWLSWGPVLGRILISPAQHQIHHSIAPAHHDHNYGFIFAVWDWMFGTLYLTRKKEDLTYGLSGVPFKASHPTVYAAYVQPFKGAAAVAARPWRARFRAEADDARA